MENVIIILILAVILFFAVKGGLKRLHGGCCGGGNKIKKIKSLDMNKSDYRYKSTVYVDGMTCEHCRVRVENAFNSLPGCLAKVNLKKKYVELWSNKILSDKELEDIIKKNGYSFIRCLREKNN